MNTKPQQMPINKGPKHNAYSLIRFSTDRQEWGDSLRRQHERCEAECTRRGWRFDERLCVTDLGVSGFRGKNFDRTKALGKFIEASKQGLLMPNPVLLVENLDRFSRDVLENAEAEFWGLIKRGVDVLVISIGGEPLTNGDQNNAIKKAIVMFEFDRAYRESQRKSELIGSVMSKKWADASEGKVINVGNYAPKWVSFYGAKLQAGEYKPNKNWNTAQWIVDSYLDDVSANEIARQLRDKHTPLFTNYKPKPKRGKVRQWSQGSVRHVLRNETLTGQVTIKGQVFKNHFPSLITHKQWLVLQGKLQANKIRQGGIANGQRVNNLFANRCECVKCGGTMTVATTNKGQYSYYLCRNGCSGSIRVDDLELEFFGYIDKYPEAVMSEHTKENEHKIASIKARMNTHTKHIDNLSQAVRDTNNLAQLVKQLNEEQALLQTAKNELEQATIAMTTSHSVPSILESIRKELGTTHIEDILDKEIEAIETALGDNDKRKQLKSILPSIVSKLVLDAEHKRFQIVNMVGQVSGWRQLLD